MKTYTSIAAYIDQFEGITAERLHALVSLVDAIAPDAAPSISYGMPAFKYKGKPLVYFAAYSKHVGVYALPTTHTAFEDQLAGFKQGKGSVQFQHKEPFPLALIRSMVEYRKDLIDRGEQ